ncbi:hypothetical protein EDD21DRAFT_370798 [Dissophora ornata]|nr:hypothetical protein EDD21DRAFT_370798 [Dissophora ornata]
MTLFFFSFFSACSFLHSGTGRVPHARLERARAESSIEEKTRNARVTQGGQRTRGTRVRRRGVVQAGHAFKWRERRGMKSK